LYSLTSSLGNSNYNLYQDDQVLPNTIATRDGKLSFIYYSATDINTKLIQEIKKRGYTLKETRVKPSIGGKAEKQYIYMLNDHELRFHIGSGNLGVIYYYCEYVVL
jgi:hypothetical protein